MTTPNTPAPPSAEDLLSGKGGGIGAPSASFNAIGDTISGLVREVRTVQKTKFMGKEYKGEPVLEFWDEAKTRPVWQVAVVLTDTGVRDPNRDGDDGTRVLYCDGNAKEADTKLGAVGAAAIAKGDASPQPGGWLSCTWTSWVAGKTYDQRKSFQAEYLTPAEVAMQGVPAHASRQSKATTNGAPAAAPAASSAGGTAPPGVDPAVWAAFLATQNGGSASADPGRGVSVAPAVPAQRTLSPAEVAAQLATTPAAPAVTPEIEAAAKAAGVDPAVLAKAMQS